MLRHLGRPPEVARRARLAGLLPLVLLGLGLSVTPVPSAARELTSAEVLELNQIAQDPSRAADAVTRARQFLAAGDIDSNYLVFLRQMLIHGLIRSSATATEIVASADTLDPMLVDPRSRMMTLGNVADALVERREKIDRALAFARGALAACPDGNDYATVRAVLRAILGRALLEHGDPDSAIVLLSKAVPAAPESQVVLFHLGRAYEKRGRDDQAIGAYVRSLAVFPYRDTTAAAALRSVYVKKNHSLVGLDAHVTTARKASRDQVALSPHRHEMRAPEWRLPDLAGKTVQLADFKGKVVVVDFWGSWCGPCRAELPHVQAVFDRYKDRGVAFVGINWERAESAEDHLKTAKTFMQSTGYSFPVVLDHDYSASQAYAVTSFPTVYLIDKRGQIRYRNIGFDPAIEDILGAQIESLME